ncbi:MAG TPA: periplasmic heavy metal sensor [Bryobacteraceae bacterium]|nr:periplasmic heavy metal sensor [Bryobacteraceae bacterium]
MKALVLALLFPLMGAWPLVAQNPNFGWWNSQVTRDLHLSQDQEKQIREIVSSYRGQLIDARASVQKAEGELQDILNSDHVDLKQSQPTIDKLAKARAESTRVFTEMSLRLRTVLTLDQWHELVERWGALKRGRRPGARANH